MTQSQKDKRNELAQQAFDRVINGGDFPENYILYQLYRADFCASEAKKAIIFIKNQIRASLKN